MKNKFESILKKVLNAVKKRKNSNTGKRCLTDEDLTVIVEGKTSEVERDKVFSHILSCQNCALLLKEHLLIMGDLDKKGMLETPQELIQAAMDLVGPGIASNMLEVVLNLKEKVIELVKATGDVLIGPELIPVPVLRSQGKDDKFENKVKIVKAFDNVLIEVVVERKKPNICDIELRLTEKDLKRKAEGLRVTLMKDNKEIESSLIDEGKIIFREIKPDRYKISIMKEGKQLGAVDISMNLT